MLKTTSGPVVDSPGTQEIQVARQGVSGLSAVTESDRVAVESPLELRIVGRSATVLMRTPGNDEDLIRGFLFGEGAIRSAADVAEIRPVEESAGTMDGRVVVVRLGPTAPQQPLERSLYSSSSCGVCGKTSLESLEIHSEPLVSTLRLSRDVVVSLPGKLRGAQLTFDETGGLHATGLFTSAGDLILAREDVGRHNAFDKVVGWALAAGRIPLSDCVALVSGRVSFELIQKAIVAGVPVVAAVGAPSSLAVRLADQFGVTLIGFLRDNHYNVYTHPNRLTPDPLRGSA